jgi:hypothetical protein
MRMMALAALPVVMMAGCAGNSAKPRNGFVEGKATVLEVNNELGMAVLKIDEKATPAYWDTEVVAPFRISAVGAHQTTPQPTGDLANAKDAIHPVEERITLPAKVGDTVVFRGMRTGDELLLRAVQVVPN